MAEQTDVVLSLTNLEYQKIVNAMVRMPWIDINDVLQKVNGQFQQQQALAAKPVPELESNGPVDRAVASLVKS